MPDSPIPLAQRFGAQIIRTCGVSLPMPDGWHLFRCGYDRNRLSDDPSDSCLDADTDNIIDGAYSYIFFVFAVFRPRIYTIHSWYHPCTGRLQDTCLFSDFIQSLKYRTGSVFISQIGTGTAGAAYATVIAQAVSGILCLIYMKKKFDILKMHREETRISTYHLYRLCMMGIPDGTSILHHCHRFGGDPDRHQLSRFHCGCLGYCRSENRYVLLLPL